MVELLRSGQPVKWDGLGTFTPNINSRGINDVESVSVDQIQGVKINFIPENSKGEQLTSKAFKDLCTFSILGKLLTNKTEHTSANGNRYYTYDRILQPLGYVGSEAENTGGGGGGTQSGGDNSGGGGTNQGGGTNGDDDDERPGAGG